MSKKIACVGDYSSHVGVVITSNQDGKFRIGYSDRAFGSGVAGSGSFGGAIPAVEGAMHSCPIPEHGITAIKAVTTKSYKNGKLILTTNAFAGCGALILPSDRKVYVE